MKPTWAIAWMFCIATLCGNAIPATSASTRSDETAFSRSIHKENTVYVVTGDLIRYTGARVAYDCTVANVVKQGLLVGECGSPDEPMSIFIHMPTGRVRSGQRLHILGVMESPASWTDLSGHTVYYAFMRAMFVH